jgi:hypothetical protein
LVVRQSPIRTACNFSKSGRALSSLGFFTVTCISRRDRRAIRFLVDPTPTRYAIVRGHDKRRWRGRAFRSTVIAMCRVGNTERILMEF